MLRKVSDKLLKIEHQLFSLEKKLSNIEADIKYIKSTLISINAQKQLQRKQLINSNEG